MASREGDKLQEETEDGSYHSISNSVSSSEQKDDDKNDNCGFTESLSAVLEPSKDKSRRSAGRHKNLSRSISIISCPGPTPYVSLSSSNVSSDHEDEQQNSEYQSSTDQQVDEPPANCCASCMNSYKIFVDKIEISWFIYLFQLFVGLLSISGIVMALIFFQSCGDPKPSPASAFFIILMGISGIILTTRWFKNVRRRRRGQYSSNCERNELFIYFGTFLFFWIAELVIFSETSPETLQSHIRIKCIKAFYDYMYYMNIAIAGSSVLATFLYLPDWIVYMTTPAGNGDYQQL